MPNPHDNQQQIAAGLGLLSDGQREVLMALLEEDVARTYPETAEALGLALGTVYTHLRRVKQKAPALYAAAMEIRREQLGRRKARSAARAAAHSAEWFRKKRNRACYYRTGLWPYQWRQLYAAGLAGEMARRLRARG